MPRDKYEEELIRLIDVCHEAGLSDHDRGEMMSLATHNEGTIALEHLCTQLHEYDIALSHETRAAIANPREGLSRWRRLHEPTGRTAERVVTRTWLAPRP